MAILTVSTIDNVWLWLTMTGVAMLALLFTSYRYVVGYFLAGMLYWLGIEVVHWLVTVVSPLSSFHAYILAVALSLIPIMLMLAVKDNLLSLKPFNLRVVGRFFRPISQLLYRPKTPTQAMPRIAGQKPFILEQDTDFTQQFVCHSSVFKYDN